MVPERELTDRFYDLVHVFQQVSFSISIYSGAHMILVKCPWIW